MGKMWEKMIRPVHWFLGRVRMWGRWFVIFIFLIVKFLLETLNDLLNLFMLYPIYIFSLDASYFKQVDSSSW